MRLLALALFLWLLPVRGQELLPYVENFGKTDFGGENQVWSLAQGSDKALYFANNHYLLRYNGVDWEQYTLPNKTIIRSVFADGDRIYCGSYREFGYWKREAGKMVYTSISDGKNLFSGNSNNEEIWKILKVGKTFYFQSFNDLFFFDGKLAGKVRFPGQVSYCYLIGDTVYVATINDGVYKLNGNSFIRLKNWGALENNVIHHMERFDGRIYAFTKNNGIYVEKGSEMVRWDHPVNDIVASQVILSAKFVRGKTLAIGTALSGLYLIDLKTGDWRTINRQNGLKNNAILSVGIDAEDDLWLGLDNGISHVEITSPVSIFSDNSGELGSVYAISNEDQGYLLATNHGVFRYKAKKLSPIPGMQGQAWNIFKDGARYIVGHNDGTFIVNASGATKVNDVTGGWEFMRGKFEDVFFQGHYAGIVIYDNRSDLTQFKRIEGLAKPIRHLQQVRKGELWAADNYRGIYRILYDSSMRTQSVENITEKSGIKNDFGARIFAYRDNILVFVNGIWYVYDRAKQKLVVHTTFNRHFKEITDITAIGEREYLVAKSGTLYRVKSIAGTFLWRQIPAKYYAGKLLTGHLNVQVSSEEMIVNLDDGFLISRPVNRATDAKISVEVFRDSQLLVPGAKIPYGSAITINAIAGRFGYNRPDLYYSLGDKPIQIRSGAVNLTNLESGRQTLKLFVFEDAHYKQVASFDFRVGYPWYLSAWMILIYILFTAAIWFFYYRWNKVRYEQKLRLEQEEMRHRQDMLELRLKAENDLKIQEYEKHILELELRNKSSEVAGKSFSIAKQGEIMEAIGKILDNESDANKLKTEIKKTIRASVLSKHEWEAFETNMKQLHQDFVEALSARYPQLTSKDIRLCIYLRMNLSSKEIAPLMNISFRGVELHRYRLRKKINLDPEVSLSKFMIDFK